MPWTSKTCPKPPSCSCTWVNEFDVLLRPILWKQLRVGARIVSHRFRMGDWMPDETIPVGEPASDDVALVHLWTITKEIKERAAKP